MVPPRSLLLRLASCIHLSIVSCPSLISRTVLRCSSRCLSFSTRGSIRSLLACRIAAYPTGISAETCRSLSIPTDPRHKGTVASQGQPLTVRISFSPST